MQTLIKRNQLELWHELPIVPENLGNRLTFIEHRDSEGDVTGQSFRLLPTNAGKGKPSLATVTGLKGDELKTAAAEQSRLVKDYLVKMALEAQRSDRFGGVGAKFTKSGRMTMSFKLLKPQVQLLTDDEMAAQLGCTVEDVAKLRTKGIAPAAPAPQPEAPKPETNGDLFKVEGKGKRKAKA